MDVLAVIEEVATEMTDLVVLERVPMILSEDQTEDQTEEVVTEAPVIDLATELKKSEEIPTAKDVLLEETREKIPTSQEILIVN